MNYSNLAKQNLNQHISDGAKFETNFKTINNFTHRFDKETKVGKVKVRQRYKKKCFPPGIHPRHTFFIAFKTSPVIKRPQNEKKSI